MTVPNPLEEIGGGLPRSFLRSCLLLLIAERPSYGYDLQQGLKELGMASADPGGLYRTLRALERDGLVDSMWDVSDVGPPRRVYKLTDDGMDWLHAWAGAHRETRRILGSYVERYLALEASKKL
jgi:PadR family transcriptional regulator PadR